MNIPAVCDLEPRVRKYHTKNSHSESTITFRASYLFRRSRLHVCSDVRLCSLVQNCGDPQVGEHEQAHWDNICEAQ